MSLTPTDDPDTQGRSQSQTTESPAASSSSIRSRLLGSLLDVRTASRHLKASLGRVARWVRGQDTERPTTSELEDSAAIPETCPRIESLPPRALPLTYPTRSYGNLDNSPDTVGDCDGEIYRIAHPDNAESFIESDTWTEVRR